MTMHELANVMNDSTDDIDFDYCYKLYNEALTFRQKKLSYSHRSVAATLYELGRLFIRKSKTAIDDIQRQIDLLRAYENLKNAFVIRSTITHGYGDKYTVAVLFFLGIVLMEMGRKNKAIVLFNEYQELSLNAKNDNTVKTIEKREQAKTYVEKLRQELINSEISRTTYTNNLLTNHLKSDDLFPLELHFSTVENNTENVVKINEDSFANTFFNYENCVKIIQEIVHYTLSIVVSIEDVQQAVFNIILRLKNYF
jgi:tetratricopeptide (TPR) repeat protein